MDAKKPLIYISHPYGANKDNLLEIEEIVRALYKNDDMYDNFCFVSPVHCYQFLYTEYESNYYKGLSFCTDLLKHCQLMLLFGDWESSKGCVVEKKMCDELNIPYIEIRTFEQFKELLQQSLLEDILKRL